MSEAASIFGPVGARLIDNVDQLGLRGSKTRYTFTANEGYLDILLSDPNRGMQIYWGEMLARAHLAAATAILRSRRWVAALISAKEDKNLLSFAAALRGLIESAADTTTALLNVPGTLARDCRKIVPCFSGQPTNVFWTREVEDQLIHFSYARHLAKDEAGTVPKSHRALTVREYIEVLEKGQVAHVVECYRAVCELTHPGISSVWMWLKPVNDLEFELAADQEDRIISSFQSEYRDTFLELLMFAFNPALVTLDVLNYFPLTQFHTPGLLKWDLSGITLWEKCRNELRGLRLQVDIRSTEVTPKIRTQKTAPKRHGKRRR